MSSFFPSELPRMKYFLRWLAYAFILCLVAALMFPISKAANLPELATPIIIVLLALFRFPCLDIPRLRNIGWSPWLIILMFIPVSNLVMQLLLFFTPPKQKTS